MKKPKLIDLEGYVTRWHEKEIPVGFMPLTEYVKGSDWVLNGSEELYIIRVSNFKYLEYINNKKKVV